jgi:hypothetical protein
MSLPLLLTSEVDGVGWDALGRQNLRDLGGELYSTLLARLEESMLYCIVALLGSPWRAASRGTAAQYSWGPLCWLAASSCCST